MTSATQRYLAKMSETNIMAQYSHYLQQAQLKFDDAQLHDLHHSVNLLLTYEQFKAYFIKGLVGKGDYLDDLVRGLQLGLTEARY